MKVQNAFALLALLIILSGCGNPILPAADNGDGNGNGNDDNSTLIDNYTPDTSQAYYKVTDSDLAISLLPLNTGAGIKGSERGIVASGNPLSLRNNTSYEVNITLRDLESGIKLWLLAEKPSGADFTSKATGISLEIIDNIDDGSRPFHYSIPTATSYFNASITAGTNSDALHTRTENTNTSPLTFSLYYDSAEQQWKSRLSGGGELTLSSEQSYPGLPAGVFDADGPYLVVETPADGQVDLDIQTRLLSIEIAQSDSGFPTFSTTYTPVRYIGTQSGTTGTSYYISSENGDDMNNGTSEATPWKTLQMLMDTVDLKPGDSILLERGSVFTEELIFFHKSGTDTDCIRLGSYGSSGENPVIASPATDPYLRTTVYNGVNVREKGWKGLTLIGGSYWKIENITFRGGKAGIFLKNWYDDWTQSSPTYNHYPHQNIEIGNCRFENIQNNPVNSPGYYYFKPDDGDDSTTDDGYNVLTPRIYGPKNDLIYNTGQDNIFWYGGIFLGQYGPQTYLDIHRNFYFHDLVFENCDMGFGAAWYFSLDLEPYLENLVMENCTGNGVLQGIVMLNHVKGALIKNVHLESGGGYSSTGIAGGFLERCSDIIIRNSSFTNMVRETGPHGSTCHDGVGFDLEGVTKNILFENTTFAGNAGAGLLICNTAPDINENNTITANPNENIFLVNCTFDGNSQNPDSVDFPDRAGTTDCEITNWQKNSSGVFRDVVFKNTIGNFFSPFTASGDWFLVRGSAE